MLEPTVGKIQLRYVFKLQTRVLLKYEVLSQSISRVQEGDYRARRYEQYYTVLRVFLWPLLLLRPPEETQSLNRHTIITTHNRPAIKCLEEAKVKYDERSVSSLGSQRIESQVQNHERSKRFEEKQLSRTGYKVSTQIQFQQT